MTLAAEKPGIVERLGSALQSTNLAPNAERDMPIDLIAALGMLQANPDGAGHGEREHASIDPSAELGAVLLRLKFGGDTTLGERGVHLLARWIRAQRAFGRWKLSRDGADIVTRFARQGLAEWLYPTCDVCHGRQVLGMERDNVVERRVRCSECKGEGQRLFKTKTGARVLRQCEPCHGHGTRTRRAFVTGKPRPCHACAGTGHRRRGVDGERIRALGVPAHVYERHWVKRFAWLDASFDRVNDLDKRGLQIQMSRRTTPTSASRK